ncbi:ATP-binding cassette domain-containing protein [Levilactobacillus brevis]|jgi:ABC-2 type transport system ATP-binding protein|uniref:ABC transporter ATP-binding protein n=1 Tax=Levilactobacillus brevis TaxID=1580 RepID=A0AA41JSP6_LEVBR|nr:ABC transporter ATP-binding protein [Levilactobacillus brevis]KID43283.1 ABC transporter, ATP-binding protein [Levilactobacillus brevis]MBS0946783.1 ABC transporter ATP-binding protein [Levilactobacillus brevis]MBS0976790.1 ABC transporter ATP-binding protein [Levilactobacillus brevis]MBS1009804.1 ABC transporter ATP-binding protein [Levilactobacillus brevis]MCU0200467.1 ABC transporter ATP-binding protein [Levilactobacillus brevis]
MTTTLSLTHISKKYHRKPVLTDVSLQANTGDIIGISGANGSGKTTLLKTILGFTIPDSGQIIVLNHPLSARQHFATNTGFALKDCGPLPNYSGLANLQLMAQLLKMTDMTHLPELLDLVGLTATNTTKVKHYSLGMYQRLCLAMSLVNDPQLVIWDEPENALDEAGLRQLQALLARLAEMGTTTILTSHNPTLLAHHVTRRVHLEAGRLLELPHSPGGTHG